MWGRRICYLAAVLGCLVLYIYYTQWAVWVLLWWLTCLPAVSLLLSLPAMLTAKLTLHSEGRVQQNQPVSETMRVQCRFPAPPVDYRLKVRHCITGKTLKSIDTTHCGGLVLQAEKVRIYDYLGLFARRVRTAPEALVIVEPQPVETQWAREQGQQDDAWRPKRGGGFSEEHELREYLPGDDLRQIHWKISAKTGKTAVRQPMEQEKPVVFLTVLLRGTPQELDRQLGRLKWISKFLLQQEQAYCVAVLSGRGLERFQVSDGESLTHMLDSVLCAPQAAPDGVFPVMDEPAVEVRP